MREKVVEFWSSLFRSPTRLLASLLIVIGLFAFFFLLFAVNVVVVLAIVFAICYISSYNIYRHEYKKEEEKRKNWEPDEYVRKHYPYVFLVRSFAQEKEYIIQTPLNDWVKAFDTCINAAVEERIRSFNDFDIAACLIYSFLSCRCSDEELTFVFECVKKIISTPKNYNVDYLLGGEIDLTESKTFKSVYIPFPNDDITEKALNNIFRAYSLPQNGRGILQLSDFLHILYLKSLHGKNN